MRRMKRHAGHAGARQYCEQPLRGNCGTIDRFCASPPLRGDLGLAAATGFFAAGFSSATGLAPSASRAARSFRATGGSIVDEGPLTNSPSSFSFSSASLLDTPNSLAISCTRGFPATSLLSGPAPGQGQTTNGGRVSFRAAHQLSMCRSACSLEDPVDPYSVRSSPASSGPAVRNARAHARRDVAVSMQSRVPCTHAPRPGRLVDASATID